MENNNLDLTIILKDKTLDFKVFVEKLKQYREGTKFETYRGFCLYVGFTPDKLRKLIAKANSGEDRNAEKIWELLEYYKMVLEVKMEEYLLYQSAHPDLEGKVVDYKQLQFLLAKSSPTHYGNLSAVGIMKIEKAKEKTPKLENDSGYTLGGNLDENIKGV